MRHLAAILTVLLAAPAAADPAGWEHSVSGLLDLRVTDERRNTTSLAAPPAEAEATAIASTYAAGFEAWKGGLALASQLRAHTNSAGDNRARLRVDELYAEYAVTPEDFLYAGRRNIVYGASLGVNPLDVFLDPRALDRAKNNTRRRREIPGQDMLGFESLVSGRFTFGGYWAPRAGELNQDQPHRALLAGALTLLDWNADVTAILIKDAHSGAGLSAARTLGDATLVYADLTARRGRDRMRIRADRSPGATPGAFVASGGNRRRLYAQASLGIGHTRASGGGFNLEYYYDANGYNSREWREIERLITDAGAANNANLARLNARLDHFTLRRHYAFLRTFHPRQFGLALDAETTVFHNLADHSGVFGLRLEYRLSPKLLLGLHGRYFYGKANDEYALRTARRSAALYVTARI